MPRALAAAVLLTAVLCPWGGQAAAAPLFEFRSGFWGNLHHFLYVLGRAQNGSADRMRTAVVKAPLDVEGLDARPADDRQAWKDAVTFYAAGLSKKDAVFDQELTTTTRTLVAAADGSDLAGLGLEPALVATLSRAAAVYRAVWWPRHSRAKAARQADLQSFVDRYGAAAVARLTALYATTWPSRPRTIDLSAYTNWAGAYSTDGGPIAFASTDDELSGSEGLEILLHEASHQWDEEIDRRLSAIAAKAGRPVPRLLSHAMIFYTSGELVASLVRGPEPYATKFGVWGRGMSDLKPLLDKYWRPYLRGAETFEDAIARIITEAP